MADLIEFTIITILILCGRFTWFYGNDDPIRCVRFLRVYGSKEPKSIYQNYSSLR